MKTRNFLNQLLHTSLALSFALASHCHIAHGATNLADTPILASNANVPGNVALVLSVEYPTGNITPYPSTGYSLSQEFVGYFDANKCYSYFISGTSNGNYFTPTGSANNHACIPNAGLWSGNYLNWALTQVVDPFRSSLTGGYRSIDSFELTILEKAWADGQGWTDVAPDHILSDATLISQSTPYVGVSNLTLRVNALGNRFLITSSGDVYASNTGVTTFPAQPASPTASTVYDLMARVQVCKSGLLENNCTPYPNGDYKPTGLIQKNAVKLNFAAFGYLNDNDIKRDGGVLRAKMAALGPVKASGSSIVPNLTPEWDGDSGIFNPNPNPTDATNSGVSNSGVINYLNKFGTIAPGYKLWDPVSELFYTAGRYFRNKGNVPEYTNNLTPAMKDGFPVITNWNDPITSSCQSNFIVGIGDTRTHADANLPGSTVRNANFQNLLPALVSSDYQVNGLSNTTISYTDVAQSTKRVGDMEGANFANLANVLALPWCCGTNNTFFMAGLAYDLHTRDFRPDIAGNQTITTFWLDTLEKSNDARSPNNDYKDYDITGRRNQFWLAAKYGGFKVPAGYSPYGTLTTLTKSQWDTDVNKNPDGTDNDDPDNYFRANNPAALQEGLDKAFNSISSIVNGSSISFATSAPSIASGSLTYATSYSSAGWTGDVVAKKLSISSSGVISTSNPIWSVASKLEATNWDSGRVIATSSTQNSGCSKTNYTASSKTATSLNNGCGTPFRFGNLSSSQKTALSSVTANRQTTLNFLRGDRSNAGQLGSKLYRDRVSILGDIVNSKVVPVGAPSNPYTDTFNPGYSSFKSSYANRTTVLYVGANDGMLHAFNGTETSGNELFAYVPNALFQGPSTPATPATDGLAQLASTAYVHSFYVDATPQVADVDFGNKGTAGGVGAADWHTLLVGGLGKGGKSYFAIDVTNPNDASKPSPLTSEANLAAAVKWEFSHPLMGFTYDTPLIVKTVKYGWVVVLTSGYNNVDGKGYIFIVDPKTGALKENPISTGADSTTNDAGLAHVNAFVADARSGLADALYAGDLLGNVWRVDLTGTSGSYSALKIATLADSNGIAQPVTTSPVIEVDTSTGKRFAFIGTGRLLSSTDLNSTQSQTFYAINDGTLFNFYTSITLPAVAGGFPITRDDMVANTNVLNGITANANKPMGYYIDLGTNPNNGKTNFINAEMASAAGTISFIANSVDNSNVCKPAGSNLTYALSYGTGQTTLTDGNGNLIQNISGVGLGTSLTFVQSTFLDSNNISQKSMQLIKCDDQGNCTVLTPKNSSAKPFTQLNWRELPTAD